MWAIGYVAHSAAHRLHHFLCLTTQVTSTTGHEAHQVNKDGLTGLLWSPEVTAIIAKMMAQMEGTVLENLYQHPEFVGRTFEKGEQYQTNT